MNGLRDLTLLPYVDPPPARPQQEPRVSVRTRCWHLSEGVVQIVRPDDEPWRHVVAGYAPRSRRVVIRKATAVDRSLSGVAWVVQRDGSIVRIRQKPIRFIDAQESRGGYIWPIGLETAMRRFGVLFPSGRGQTWVFVAEQVGPYAVAFGPLPTEREPSDAYTVRTDNRGGRRRDERRDGAGDSCTDGAAPRS